MTYTEKCKWLADFYREASETGREMEINCPCDGWIPSEAGPDRFSVPRIWRLKPEPQKAWVVWGPGGPSVIIGEDIARQYARECGGTIQQITRPDV
jgi:hypothetical protein